jgi:Zn finger protein HypA/HybF involved in hydrogenase expression
MLFEASIFMGVFNDTYDIKFFCRNCEETGNLEIPRGTKLEDMSCPHCRCKTLELYRRPKM